MANTKSEVTISSYLSDFVYGGIDGSVTTFAIVAGVTGASLSPTIVLILGFANLFADGFSMAVGAYLSEKADQQLEAKNNNISHEKDDTPMEASIATFISFIIVGLVPLSVYIADYVFSLGLGDSALVYSIFLTLAAFSAIGYLRAVVTKIDRAKSVLESLGLGVAAALISYTLGSVLEQIIT